MNSGLVAGLHPSGGPVLENGDGLSLSCEQRPEIVPRRFLAEFVHVFLCM